MKMPSFAFKSTSGVKIAIGLVAGGIVVVGGFLLIQNINTRASDTAPRDIIINTITANSSKIVWTTDQEVQGVVEYGSSPTALNLFAPESAKTKTHSVDITLLSPGTSYYFQIRVGDTKYDNGGVPWTFSTKATGANSGGPNTASTSATLVPTPPSGVVNPTSSSAFGPLQKSSLKVVPTSAAIPTTSYQAPVITSVPTPTPTPALTSIYCIETDCQQICLKRLQGLCSTYEWAKAGCTGKVDPRSCYFITPTPTWNPLTPTPLTTSTPTPTPTISTTPAPTTPSYMQ